MKKWNTSITFEKKEEAIGVLIALEKYKDQHKDEGVDSESRQAGTYRRRCRRNFSTMWIFGSRFKSVLRWNHYDGNAGGSVFIDLG